MVICKVTIPRENVDDKMSLCKSLILTHLSLSVDTAGGTSS